VAAGSTDLEAGERALLAAAATAVGLALHVHDGSYDPAALALIGLATVATLAALMKWSPRLQPGALAVLLGGLVALEVAASLTRPVARGLPDDQRPFLFLVGGALTALVVLAVDPRWLGRGRPAVVAALAGLHFAAGAWLLRHAPPLNDVFSFQQGALEALRHGRNPYAITTFRNVYAPYVGFYPPGAVVAGVLQFGYPHLPLPLLFTAAAVPFGDLRYAPLAALALAGATLASAPGRVAALAAGVLLFSPRVWLLLQMSWQVPFAILFLALTVSCARRAPRLLPVPLGLLLACEPYLLLLAPVAPLLLGARPDGRRLVTGAVALALAVSLPLALWDLPAFVHSAVMVPLHAPLHWSALSVPAAVARAGGPLVLWPPLVLAPAALILALRRAPRAPAGFAMTAALLFLLVFAFHKQAYCNHYFLPIAALCTAIAAGRPE